MAARRKVGKLSTKKGMASCEGLQEAIDAIGNMVDSMSFGSSAAIATDGQKRMKRVFMAGAMKLVAEAKDLAPYDPDRKDGTHLRDAIYAAYGPDKKPNVVVGVNYKKAPHAWLEEFGTADRTTKAGANRGQAKPTPYMRPALAASRPLVLQVINEGLQDLISDLEKKYGTK